MNEKCKRNKKTELKMQQNKTKMFLEEFKNGY